MNKFYFKEITHYTFEEVSTYIINNLTTAGGFPPFDTFGINQLFLVFPLVVDGENVYGLSFITLNGYNWEITELGLTCLNKLYLRYKDHFCCDLEDENEKETKFKAFFFKLFNILDYSYNKYSKLLDLYNSQKEHLLDKLQRTRSGERSMSQEGENSNENNSLSLYNDTPQTTDVVATMEENQYVSELNKGHTTTEGSSSSSGSDEYEETESWDNTTIMARLDEIEKQYALVWRKWLNEFDGLFVEEVNY